MKGKKIIISNEDKELMKHLYEEEKMTIEKISKSLGYSMWVTWKTLTKITRLKNDRRKYKVNDNYFQTIDTEDKAYFLGLLISDGWIRKNGFGISLQERDIEIIQKLKTAIEYNGKISIRKGRNGDNDQAGLSITSINIEQDLIKLGCIRNKSHFTYFPDIPEEFWSHFIRGVFDGDGCIGIYPSNYSYHFDIMGNEKLINRIQEIIIEKCNVKKTKLLNKEEHHTKNIIYMVYYSKSDIINIRNWLYKDATLYLKRKHKKFFSIN